MSLVWRRGTHKDRDFERMVRRYRKPRKPRTCRWPRTGLTDLLRGNARMDR